MVQEIITYIIVAVAIIVAVVKSVKKLKSKKRVDKADYGKVTLASQHDCSDCSAECMLRNAVGRVKENDSDLCRKIDIKPKL